MMRFAAFLVVIAACGGSSSKPMPDAAKDTGFNMPTRPLQHCAASGCSSDPTMDPVSDLSCLGMPSADQATSVAITLTTIVKDFQSQNPVPGAKVIAFDDTSYTSPWDMQTADQNGNITFNVPVGRKRFGFEMTTTDGTT